MGTSATLTIASDPAPLEVTPEGRVVVAGTTLPFEYFMGAYRRGDTPGEIVEAFPALTLAMVYRLYAYYLDHPEDVDAWLAGADREEQEMAAELEELFPTAALRERARQQLAELRASRTR
ncbi:MAG TPA: DUF433 domain-containing protein [Tepidiformaceae bacterium]|nr:DUF433 domain-containing protein [Tepidiformaceae bacterium]